MISFALLPKPFNSQFDIIQRNCLRSILNLPCEKEVFVFGDESGVAEIASELNLKNIGNIEKDEFGTPLLSVVFDFLKSKAKYDVICYVNCDIIIFPEFVETIIDIKNNVDEYLLVAKRWNIDLNTPINFDTNWSKSFNEIIEKEGILFVPQAIDIFVLPKSIDIKMPPFAIGRSYFDNFIIKEFKRLGIAVIDCTNSFKIVHQNHKYANFDSIQDIRDSIQGKRNFYLAGDNYMTIASINDATFKYIDKKLVKSDFKFISVIIPHYGDIAILKSCIRALTYQTYPRTFYELVVVINDYRINYGTLINEFPFVKICAEYKPGPAAARNKGVICSKGEIIAFLDSDCTPKSNWLEKSIEKLAANDPETIIAGDFEKRQTDFKNPAAKFHYLFFLQQQIYVDQNRCISGNLMLYRSLFYKAGLFDESFTEASGEDWEWASRAEKVNAKFVFCNETAVYHPLLTKRSQLRQRFIRTVKGNALRARKEINVNQDSKQEFDGRPSYTKLKNRIRSILSSSAITNYEKVYAITLLLFVWPKLVIEWNKTIKKT